MEFFKCAWCLLILALGIIGCTPKQQAETDMTDPIIMEVTTFKINPTADPSAFADRDAQVERDFTSQQSGFIKRQSGVDDQGNYLVIVYWENNSDADASMNKFMRDASVADYAQMIDGPSMNMTRYTMDQPFTAAKSTFVEVMSFKLQPKANVSNFDALNKQVETDFTGRRKGFLQRLTGVNETGAQVVAVYWTNKTDSDDSIEPFMAAPIAKEFMAEMDQSTIAMGRYQLLNATTSK